MKTLNFDLSVNKTQSRNREARKQQKLECSEDIGQRASHRIQGDTWDKCQINDNTSMGYEEFSNNRAVDKNRWNNAVNHNVPVILFSEIMVRNLLKTGKIKCARAHYSFNLSKMMRFALLSTIMVIILIFSNKKTCYKFLDFACTPCFFQDILINLFLFFFIVVNLPSTVDAFRKVKMSILQTFFHP